ncbi:zinc finger CCCH domain-containing protein 48-like [Salvia hispanica]|uniref:zinc finger CCCH domain-containing protein 48-like n=1 Tax=Salvia hispanica TaxID=49212 RepID=UPI0020093DE1|nr:zinc finger CCCH domain-containing protein 48-like [Salvia hispanica]
MDVDGGRRIFKSLGPSSSTDHRNNNTRQQKVCFHWEKGNCSRNPCPFLHPTAANGKRGHQGFGAEDNYRGGGGLRRSGNYNFSNSNHSNSWGRPQPQQLAGGNRNFVRKVEKKICNYWVQGSCRYGDTCKFLHHWSTDSFTLLTTLEGHKQAVTGITLPSGSDKLYSGSEDETVRVWDCQSGQLSSVVNLGCSVGCMLSEGPWVFVGLTNLVKAWNVQTSMELSLSGPVGQVYSIVVGNDLLFAGNKDGTILAWKFNAATNYFEPAASLKGHTLAVVTLVVGGNRMYSGSMDHTIRVWSLETLQCIQTLTGHNHVVTSVLCWNQFLISASLDNTVKFWATTESGNLEVTYTHTEEQGLITLCGMHDSESKPVLFCSCNDNSVRVYDLPSFSERGKIFSKEEVRSLQIGPGGLFFTGDGSGQVRVWKWSSESTTTS